MNQMRSEQAEQDKLLSKQIELAKARGEDTTQMQREQLQQRLQDLKDNLAEEDKAYQDQFGDSVKRSKERIDEQKAALQFLVDNGKRGFSDLSSAEKELFQQLGGDIIDNVESLKSGIIKETEFLEGYLTESREKFGKTTQAQLDQAAADIEIFNARTTASEKAEQQKKLDNYKQYLRDRQNAERRIEDLKLKLMEDGLEKELELNRINFERQIQDITAKGKQKQEIIDLLNDLQLKKEKEIQEKFRQQRLDDFMSSIEPLKLAEDAKTEIVLKGIDERTEAQIAAAKSVADTEKAIQDARMSNIEAGVSLFKDLVGENNKLQAIAIAAESAVSIAKTIINTQAANAATTAQGAALAIPSAGASVAAAAALVTQNNISAGISIAAQIAAAAKGISALGGGASPASGGGLGSDSGAAAQAPSFNVVGDSGINQIASIQQQPVQAFVVSGEVTTSQALDRNRVENATL
jgi:hypothetical protein